MPLPFHSRLRSAAALLVTACALVALDATPAQATRSPLTCAPVIVIGIRGTDQAPGAYSNDQVYASDTGGFGTTDLSTGYTVTQAPTGARREALRYPATSVAPIYPLSVDAGKTALKARLEWFTQTCPSQRYVLIGYSQGAHVIGDTLVSGLSAATKARIKAVVFFADPSYRAGEPYNYGLGQNNGTFARSPGQLSEFSSRIRSYCFPKDRFCQNDITDTTVHNSSYSTAYVQQHATDWILGRLGPPPVANRDHVSDWSGDGAADVLGVNAAGDLYYYPNNGLTLSAPTQLGFGWATFK
ncbi:cutinase family protein, partial [Catellatospora methionotrophica]